MKMRFLAKQAEKLIEDNAPTILAGVAIVGTAATAYLSVRATSNAIREIEDTENNGGLKWSEMTKPVITGSRVKMVWRHYIPPVATGALTITCIAMGTHMNTKRAAAMAAAYSLSEKKLSEYRGKIEEKLGIEKKQEIENEIVEDKLKNTPKSADMVILGGDDVLCFDSYSGRYFKSSMESIRAAANDTNFEVINSRFTTLEFFWEKLGLEPTAYSDEMGWSESCPLHVRFTTMMSGEDRPALVVDYDVEPVRGWNHRFE